MDRQDVEYSHNGINLAIKRNEVLIHPTTWMSFENTMQIKISETQKATYCMISFIRNVQNKVNPYRQKAN